MAAGSAVSGRGAAGGTLGRFPGAAARRGTAPLARPAAAAGTAVGAGLRSHRGSARGVPRARGGWRSRRGGSCGVRRRAPFRGGAHRAARRLRWRRSWPSLLLVLLTLRRVPAARHRPAARLPPGARPDRLAGLGDRAADGRGAHLPLPALRQPGHTGLAACARRQGRPRRRGLDGAAAAEDDDDRRRGVPRRRHDDRLLRARRRLAADQARQDRQAGVPRQLRHDRTRPRRAQARSGRRAVGDPEEGQGRHLVAGQPARAAAPRRPGRRPVTHLRPAAAAQGRARRRRAVPAGARHGDVRARASACCSLWRPSSAGRAGSVAGLVSGLVLLLAGVAAAAVSTVAKWLLVGRFRTVEHPLWSSFVWRNELADTFVEMVAVPGSRRRSTAPPRSTCGCVPSVPASAEACGARPTGCPRPTWFGWATRRRSIGAACCRPTCSMIGS